jgi:hypothetical protein
VVSRVSADVDEDDESMVDVARSARLPANGHDAGRPDQALQSNGGMKDETLLGSKKMD